MRQSKLMKFKSMKRSCYSRWLVLIAALRFSLYIRGNRVCIQSPHRNLLIVSTWNIFLEIRRRSRVSSSCSEPTCDILNNSSLTPNLGGFLLQVLYSLSTGPADRQATSSSVRIVRIVSRVKISSQGQLSGDYWCQLATRVTAPCATRTLHTRPPSDKSEKLAKMWHRCLLLQLCITGGFSFNIDTNSAVVYQGAQDSWFGFSVAAHRDQDTGWWVNLWYDCYDTVHHVILVYSPPINIYINITHE